MFQAFFVDIVTLVSQGTAYKLDRVNLLYETQLGKEGGGQGAPAVDLLFPCISGHHKTIDNKQK